MRLLAVLAVALMVLPSALVVLGEAPGNAAAASLPSWTRIFHLHDGAVLSTATYDWLNSSGPANPPYNDYDADGFEGITIKKNVPPQRYHVWVLHPEVTSDVNLVGPLSAYIWARSRDNESGSQIYAAFYDMEQGELADPALWTLISDVTVPMLGPVYSQFKFYNLTTPSVSYTLLQGHYLVLFVQRGDSLNDGLIVHYDKSDYDSYAVVPTENFVSLDSAWIQDSAGVPRSTLPDVEPATVVANVSNPFGAYDIVGASAAAYFASNGTPIGPPLTLTLVQTDTSAVPVWKRFEGTLPALPPGDLIVNVSAMDPQGYPTWINVSLSVVAVDHFDVVTPEGVEAGTTFSMTVTARDSSNNIVDNWYGTVLLEAYYADMVTPADGSLSNSTVVFVPLDLGVVVISDQTYDVGEEEIRIRASAGAHEGWSPLIRVSSGPVVSISISPPGPVTRSPSDPPLWLNASGTDANGNANTTWAPVWSIVQGDGSIVGSGLSVQFVGVSVGLVNITCTNPSTGALDYVIVQVTTGLLFRIDIASPTYPLVLREAESQALSATGYDEFDNVVDITGATWDTNTSGVVVGSGGSAIYAAGYIPESGSINVRLGSIVGTLDVVVLNSLIGPWLAPIPDQIKNEDSGAWSLSLSGYWQDVNGTSTLDWWTEGVNTSLYFISHNPESDALMDFHTQPDQSGEDEFTLWVIDTDGYRAYETVTVRILAVNDKPIFVHSPPSTLVVRNDTLYTFDYSYYISDVDDPKTDLALSVSPEGLSSNIFFDGLIASFLFPRIVGQTSYSEFASIIVTDPSLASSQLDVLVKVTDDHPPSMNRPIEDQTIYEGDIDRELFDLDDYFYDLDDDFLVFSSGFQNVVVSIDDLTHIVYVSAPYEWSGTTEGTFTATDPEGALKVDTILITVIAVNDAPVIIPIPDVHVRYGVTYSLYVSMYVSDPDHPLDSLAFATDSPYATHFMDATGAHMLRLLFPANLSSPVYTEPYMVVVILNVSDPLDKSSEKEFNVLVSDNMPPEIILPNPEQIRVSFPEDGYLNGSLRFGDIFSDSDDSELSYFVHNYTKVFPVIYPDGTVNLTAEVNWSGTEEIRLMAVDSHGAWAMLGVTVTVTEVNDAPVIDQIRDIIVKGGARSMRIWILANLTDSDDALSSLKVSPSPPEDVTYVGGELYVELPEGVDVITVTIVANDGELDSNMVTFKVGVSKTIKEIIGWPYSFPLVLLAAGVAGYFVASRLPRPYALENLFLIHNDGRLVSHVTKEENTNLDKDVVSAMFTAVQEFVRDSFQKGEVGLKKLEIGEKSVVIEKGQSAYAALIYTGWPKKDIFEMLVTLIRDIEERYKGRIEHWNGTMKSLKGVDKMLQDYMVNAYEPGVWAQEEAMAEQEWVEILSKEG